MHSLIDKIESLIGINLPDKNLFLALFLQHPGISSTLRPRHGENIAEKSITVCSGSDMVNINLAHFVFNNKEDADVRIHK